VSAIDRLREGDAVARLTARDATLFSDDAAVQAKVANRLGWLELALGASDHIADLTKLADEFAEGATDLLLLGMGGSSLAPLVMERIIGVTPGRPRLHVLDTTSPVRIAPLLQTLDPAATRVLIASKSGGTIEPMSLYAIVRTWLERTLSREEAGSRCVAITDPGMSLEQLAERDLFHAVVNAPPTVGGRYSALSVFGLLPAALLGIDLGEFAYRARAMEVLCATPAEKNPAALLAAWIADAHAAGRDKLTLVASELYAPLGLWIEQLVAESLGKEGVGVVPVIEYGWPDPAGFGADRAVVTTQLVGDETLALWSHDASAAHAAFDLMVADAYDLGAQFVMWEYATALAGYLLGVNPFDEPAVTEAKEATTAILRGEAGAPAADAEVNGTNVTYAGGLTLPAIPPSTRVEALRAAIGSAQPGDYLVLLVYAPDDGERFAALREAATAVSHSTGRAVCLELGPRYLHSTGQLHKGGPNSGVFVLVTARDTADIEIPGATYTLAALHRAQADGDLVTLARHGRRVMRLDLPDSSAETLATLAADLVTAAG
jgi:glucose-6-phosphate isomerase